MHELCLYPSQEQFTIYIWRTLFLEFYDTCKLKDAAARERGRGVGVQARSQGFDPFNLVSDADQRIEGL